jgi:hypothetical protein
LRAFLHIVLNILLYRCHIPKPKQISWSLWKEKENDRLKIFTKRRSIIIYNT